MNSISSTNERRNSSLELLRIISMFVIVAYHYSLHGGYDEFSAYTFCGGVVFVQLLGLFGKVACSVFALISGYFLIAQTGSKQKQLKRAFPLLMEMHFYYLIILVFVLITHLVPVSASMWIKSFFPLFFGTWYIKYYILLLLFAPFLGPWLRSLEENTYKKLVILVLLIWSAAQTVTNAAWDFGEMDFFFVMYILGGYLRLHGKNLPARKKAGMLSAVFIVLMIASVFALDIAGKITGISKLIDYATYFRRYDTVLALGCAVSLFLYFRSITFHSGLINRIAGATLGIYLIHNNALIDTYIWRVLYPNAEYIYHPYLHALIKIVCVFLVSLILELIRQATVDRAFRAWLDKNYEKIWSAIRSVYLGAARILDRFLA